MIVALCSGQGRTFTEVTRTLGSEVSAVICDQPEAPVLQRAKDLCVKSHCIARRDFENRSAHEAAVLDALTQCAPFSIVALLGYMRILSEQFLEEMKKRWPLVDIINLHPAPLSQYQGASGLSHAIAIRAPRWGISVHRVTPDLDAGPLLAFRHLDVFPTDTFETLRDRAHPLEVSAVLEAITTLNHRRSLP